MESISCIERDNEEIILIALNILMQILVYEDIYSENLGGVRNGLLVL